MFRVVDEKLDELIRDPISKRIYNKNIWLLFRCKNSFIKGVVGTNKLERGLHIVYLKIHESEIEVRCVSYVTVDEVFGGSAELNGRNRYSDKPPDNI